MSVRAHHLALLALTLPASAQTAAPRTPLNHTLVFLDPAHGGDDDPGARLTARTGEPILERDITLALATRLRTQLAAFGLTVLATREAAGTTAEPPTAATPAAAAAAARLQTPEGRAGLANHAHPFACIILHATGSGSGVHLITSALSPEPDPVPGEPARPVSWNSAQAAYLPQSRHLAAELATALARAGLPVHIGRACARPLENLTCPAVLLELAPLPSASVADAGYQARVTEAVSTALLFWRGHAEPDSPADAGTAAAASQP